MSQLRPIHGLRKITCVLLGLTGCLVGCSPEPIDTQEVFGRASEPGRDDQVRQLEEKFMTVLGASGLAPARVDQLRLTLDGKIPPESVRFVDMVLSWVKVVISRLSSGGESPVFTVQLSSTLAIELVQEARGLNPEKEASVPAADDLRNIAQFLGEEWKTAKIPVLEVLQGFALVFSKSELLVGELKIDEVRAILLDELMSLLLANAKPGFSDTVEAQRDAVAQALVGQAGAAPKVALVLEDALIWEQAPTELGAGRSPLLSKEPASDDVLLCYAFGSLEGFEYQWEKNGSLVEGWKTERATISNDEPAEYRCAARKKQSKSPWSFSAIFRSGKIDDQTTRVSIAPASPVSGDALRCVVESEEPKADTDWEYAWLRNGARIEEIITQDFPGPLEKADRWQCEARLKGGVVAASKSQIVTIGNSAPVITAAPTVLLSSNKLFSGIECRFPQVLDPDGKDQIHVRNKIVVDGVVVLEKDSPKGAAQILEFPAFGLLPKEHVACRSEAHDGTSSSVRESSPVDRNSVPAAFVLGGHSYGSVSETGITIVAAGNSGIEIFERAETVFSRVRRVTTIEDSVDVALSQNWLVSRSSTGKIEVFALERNASLDPLDWSVGFVSQLSRSGERFLDFDLDGTSLVVSSDMGRVYVIDLMLSGGGGPFSEAVVVSPSGAYVDVRLNQGILYALRGDALDIYDLATLSTPNLISSTPLVLATQLSVFEDAAYVVASGDVTRWDISNRASPLEQGRYDSSAEVIGLDCRGLLCAALDGARKVVTLNFADPMDPQVSGFVDLPAPAEFVKIAGALGEVQVGMAEAGLIRYESTLTTQMISSLSLGQYTGVLPLADPASERFLFADGLGLAEVAMLPDGTGANVLNRVWTAQPLVGMVSFSGGIVAASQGAVLEWRSGDFKTATHSLSLTSDIEEIFQSPSDDNSFYVRLSSNKVSRYKYESQSGFVLEAEWVSPSALSKCLGIKLTEPVRGVVCSLVDGSLLLLSFDNLSAPAVSATRALADIKDFAVSGERVMVLGDTGMILLGLQRGGTEWTPLSSLESEPNGAAWLALAGSPTSSPTFAAVSARGVTLVKVEPSGSHFSETTEMAVSLSQAELSAPIRMIGERLFLGLKGLVFY